MVVGRKTEFGGLEVTEAKQLRTQEEKNAKLKKLLAEAMLDIAVLKDISTKKLCRPARSDVQSLMPGTATG